ncbi:MAG: sigma-70 family RNA polymerase sigma factor [Gemmatimonadota bacterium]
MTEPGKEPTRKADFHEEALPHMDAVFRFVLRLSASRDVAEDIVQETFLRAFRSWDKYTPGTQCKSWLFTICRNVFLRQRERGQRHDEIVSENVDRSSGPFDVVNPVWVGAMKADPEGEFFDSIVDDVVLQQIQGLPEDYRTAVLLSDLEGFSYQEIAEMTDVPVGTVKSRLFRGRRILQGALYDYAVSMGYIKGSADET